MPALNHPWALLTNHAYVLACIAADPRVRFRDMAKRVGITERACMRIIVELGERDLIAWTREGRRNVYKVFHEEPVGGPIGGTVTVGALLAVVNMADTKRKAGVA